MALINGLGDMEGFFSSVGHAVSSAAKAAVRPSTYGKIGGFVGKAALFPATAGFSLGKGFITSAASGGGKLAGGIVKLPFGVLGAAGKGVASAFSKPSSGPPAPSLPSVPQNFPADYPSTPPWPSGGQETALMPSSSPLMVDDSGTTPAEKPQLGPSGGGILDWFKNAPTATKLLLGGGAAAALYFAYTKFIKKGGRSAKGSKS